MPSPGASSCALAGLMVVGALTATASPAAAQERSDVDLDAFTPALDADGFIGIQSTRTPGPWLWNVGLVLRHDWRAVEPDPEGDEALVDHRTVADALFQLGLGGRGALGLVVPVVLHQAGAGTEASSAFDLPGQALGDPWLLARYRFWGEATTEDGQRRDGPGLALQAGAAFPLGADRGFVGDDAFRSQLTLLGDFHLFGAAIGVNLGWLHRFDPQRALGARYRDALQYGLALRLPTVVVRNLDGLLELRGATDAGSPFGSTRTTPLEGDIGLRYRVGELAFSTFVGGAFTRAPGVPDLRVGLGVRWAPRKHDQDGDGIADGVDQCPPLPEDQDGFEDEDGCPDPDNDNDLIPDEDDRCPNEEALEGYDEDEDGCTDPGAPG